MFAYCGNNPVNCSDPSGFCICAAGGLKNDFANSFMCPSCGYASGNVGAGIIGTGIGISLFDQLLDLCEQAVATISAAFYGSREEEKTEAIAITATGDSRRQAFFPANPLEFQPAGLIMRIYVAPGEGKKGGIIKWEIPFTGIAIFEWDEDFVNGPHYHIMAETWGNKHLDPNHYRAGEPVPEPWNTLYFGG